MKKVLIQGMRTHITITKMLSIVCIGLFIMCIIQNLLYHKMINKQIKKYTELLITQQIDISEFPNKKLGKFELTWYCPCEKCVGKKKIIRTATGTTPGANRTIAVDPKQIPLGSIVYIVNHGYFIAEDTGGAIKGNRIDIFVDSHTEALQYGRKVANVYLLK